MNSMLGLLLITLAAATPSASVRRELTVEGLSRSYLYHLPPTKRENGYPVVMVLHGAGMNADWMMWYSEMNRLADQEGFLAVYPNGTGFGPFLTWNSGGVTGFFARNLPDDVSFLDAVLDDLASQQSIDQNRVYGCGYSNGGMMCYKLAVERSSRYAAIGSVAGTMMSLGERPERPVSVLHIHGTADPVVPPDGPAAGTPPFLQFLSVPATIAAWCDYDGCDPQTPAITLLPDTARDRTTSKQSLYGPGRDQSEVCLIEVQGGGHTWPGSPALFTLFLGKTSRDFSANEVLWDFFDRHPLPPVTHPRSN